MYILRSEEAFTLIEILIVISIITILSVVGITNFTGTLKNARDAQRKSDLNAITTAYETHYNSSDGYLPLQDSWFTTGKIPTPPEGGSYLGLISAPSLIGFKVCATLENSPSYCKSSSQIAYSGGNPTPAPSSTSAPSPSSTSFPTPTAPIFDASTTAKQNSGTTISFSHISGSLIDGFLIVGLSYRAHNNPSAQASSVTYGGSAMTFLSGSRKTNNDRATEIWYKVLGNTPNGSNTISVVMSADPEDLVVGAATYRSVNQASPVGTAVTNAGSIINESISIPTDANDTAFGVLSIYPYGSTNTSTTSSPAVQRWKDHSANNNIEGTASEISNTSAGTTTINWTSSQGPTWTASGVALKSSLTPQPTVTPTPTTIPIAKTTYNLKVLAIGFDPTDGSGDLDSNYFSSLWGSWGASSAATFEDAVFNQAINDFKQLSGNYINYQITQKIRITQFPTYDNGFQFSVSNYSNCIQGSILPNGLTCDQQKQHFDTGAWFSANNICQTAQSIGADEIWIIGAPWIMIWESFMVGPDYGFSVNGGTYVIPSCSKHYIIVNPTYDRPDLFLHSYGHRIESTMNYLTAGVWNPTDIQNYWEKFANINRYGNPTAPAAGCGNTHFPLNASAAYDVINTSTKSFNCPDWKNFPNFTGASESINCNAWGCNDKGWQKHWLESIPSSADAINMIGANGQNIIFRKDWWYYILFPDNAIAFHNNPSVLGSSTTYSQYFVQNVFEKLFNYLLKLRL